MCSHIDNLFSTHFWIFWCSFDTVSIWYRYLLYRIINQIPYDRGSKNLFLIGLRIIDCDPLIEIHKLMCYSVKQNVIFISLYLFIYYIYYSNSNQKNKYKNDQKRGGGNKKTTQHNKQDQLSHRHRRTHTSGQKTVRQVEARANAHTHEYTHM